MSFMPPSAQRNVDRALYISCLFLRRSISAHEYVQNINIVITIS